MAAPHSSPEIDAAAIDAAKRVMRARSMAAREECDPTAAAEAVTALVPRDCPPPPCAVVSGFWPIGREIEIRPLLLALHARGHTIVLPVTPRRGNPLSCRVWRPGDTLVVERFGTMRPSGRPAGEERSPDFLLVPLLAFDRRGGRLGYGGGFYDRTFAGLVPSFALGSAYAALEVAEVPMGPDDVWLDAVATEGEIIACSSRGSRLPSPVLAS